MKLSWVFSNSWISQRCYVCKSVSKAQLDCRLLTRWQILYKWYICCSKQLFNFLHLVILCPWPSIQRNTCHSIFWLQCCSPMGFRCSRRIFDYCRCRGCCCHIGNYLLLLFTMFNRMYFIHIFICNRSYFGWSRRFNHNVRLK